MTKFWLNLLEFPGIHIEAVQPPIPAAVTHIDYSEEAVEYEKKLVQVITARVLYLFAGSILCCPLCHCILFMSAKNIIPVFVCLSVCLSVSNFT